MHLSLSAEVREANGVAQGKRLRQRQGRCFGRCACKGEDGFSVSKALQGSFLRGRLFRGKAPAGVFAGEDFGGFEAVGGTRLVHLVAVVATEDHDEGAGCRDDDGVDKGSVSVQGVV